jgi:plastocyanin
MSILGRKVSVKVVMALMVCLVAGALIPAMSKTPSRQIALVARGMAFYLESDPDTPNPVIELRPGETVRVVLRNDERGMTHDFVVPSLRGARTDLLDWKEQGSVTFTAPTTPGSYEYACEPHRLMMRGVLRVVS